MARVVGKETRIVPETGEERVYWVVEEEVKDKDFVKVFVEKLMPLLEEHDKSQKGRKSLAYYFLALLEFMDEANKVHLSEEVYETLLKRLKVKRKSLQNVLLKLQDYNLITKVMRGVYMVNPLIASVVKAKRRGELIEEYEFILRYKVEESKNSIKEVCHELGNVRASTA